MSQEIELLKQVQTSARQTALEHEDAINQLIANNNKTVEGLNKCFDKINDLIDEINKLNKYNVGLANQVNELTNSHNVSNTCIEHLTDMLIAKKSIE